MKRWASPLLWLVIATGCVGVELPSVGGPPSDWKDTRNIFNITETIWKEKEKGPEIRIFVHCPGHFTACFLRRCPYVIVKRPGCIACNCQGISWDDPAGMPGSATSKNTPESSGYQYPEDKGGNRVPGIPAVEEIFAPGPASIDPKGVDEPELNRETGGPLGGSFRDSVPDAPFNPPLRFPPENIVHGGLNRSSVLSHLTGAAESPKNLIFERVLRLNSVTLYLGSFDWETWNRFLGVDDSSELFNGTLPLIVYDFRRDQNHSEYELDLDDVLEDEEKLAGRPVLIPILMREALALHNPQNDPTKSATKLGHMYLPLPFRPKLKEGRSLPFAVLPNCPLLKYDEIMTESLTYSETVNRPAGMPAASQLISVIQDVLHKMYKFSKTQPYVTNRNLTGLMSCFRGVNRQYFPSTRNISSGYRPGTDLSDLFGGFPHIPWLNDTRNAVDAVLNNAAAVAEDVKDPAGFGALFQNLSTTFRDTLKPFMDVAMNNSETVTEKVKATSLLEKLLQTLRNNASQSGQEYDGMFEQALKNMGQLDELSPFLTSANWKDSLSSLDSLSKIMGYQPNVKWAAYSNILSCSMGELAHLDLKWLVRSLTRFICNGTSNANPGDAIPRPEPMDAKVANTTRMLLKQADSKEVKLGMYEVGAIIKKLAQQADAPPSLVVLKETVDNFTKIATIEDMKRKASELNSLVKRIMGPERKPRFVQALAFLKNRNTGDALMKFLKDSGLMLLFSNMGESPGKPTCGKNLRAGLCSIMQIIHRYTDHMNLSIAEILQFYSNNSPPWPSQGPNYGTIGTILEKLAKRLDSRGIPIYQRFSECSARPTNSDNTLDIPDLWRNKTKDFMGELRDLKENYNFSGNNMFPSKHIPTDMASVINCKIRIVMNTLRSASLCDKSASEKELDVGLIAEPNQERISAVMNIIQRFSGKVPGYRPIHDILSFLDKYIVNKRMTANFGRMHDLVRQLAKIAGIRDLRERWGAVASYLADKPMAVISEKEIHVDVDVGDRDLVVSFYNFMNETRFVLWTDQPTSQDEFDLCHISRRIKNVTNIANASLVGLFHQIFLRSQPMGSVDSNGMGLGQIGEILDSDWSKGLRDVAAIAEIARNLVDNHETSLEPLVNDADVQDSGMQYRIPDASSVIKRISNRGNLTVSELDYMFRGILRAFGNHNVTYKDFLKNLTRLLDIYPYPNKVSAKMCVGFFKLFKRFPAFLAWQRSDNGTKFNACKKQLLQPFSQNDKTHQMDKIEQKANELNKMANRLGEALKRIMVGCSDGTEAYSTASCLQGASLGILHPRSEEQNAQNQSVIPVKVEFETRPNIQPQLEEADVYRGMVWLNTRPGFDANKFIASIQSHRKKVSPTKEGGAEADQDSEEAFWKRVEIPLAADDATKEAIVNQLRSGENLSVAKLFRNTSSIGLLIRSGDWIVSDPGQGIFRGKRDIEKGIELPNVIGRPSQTIDVNDDDDDDDDDDDEKDEDDDEEEEEGPNESNACIRKYGVDMPRGWRCVQERDMVSVEAQLRLMTPKNSPVGVGILTAFPIVAGDETASTNMNPNEARNVVVITSDESVKDKIQGATFEFQKDLFEVTLDRTSQTTLDVRDLVTIEDMPNVPGIKMLRDLRKSNPVVAKFFSRLAELSKWPDLNIEIEGSILRNDLVIRYRPDSKSSWKLVVTRSTAYRSKIPFTAQFQIQPKSAFKTGKKYLNMKMQGHSAVVSLKVKPQAFVLRMVVPEKYKLPAVKYRIEENSGFEVFDIVRSLVPEEDREQIATYSDTVGLAITVPPESKIGKWQFTCSSCPGWRNIEDIYHGELDARKQAQGLLNGLRKKDPSACSYTSASVRETTLLPHDTKLRFQPNAPDYFWKATQAWFNSVISLTLYHLPEGVGGEVLERLRSDGAVAINGTRQYDDNCHTSDTDNDTADSWKSKVVDLTKILADEIKNFVIEREGCDGKRSSMKTKIDSCGVCGGDGESCIDCHGIKNGDAFRDDCGVCVGGETKRNPTKLDCAKRCDNSSYEDSCGYCQTRKKPAADKRDCAGVCYGRAEVDKCGMCKADSPLKQDEVDASMIMDECGICGGDGTSCLDCDGVPNGRHIVDKCGQCKLPSDPTINEECGEVYVIERLVPSVLVAAGQADVTVYGYFADYDTASCLVSDGVQTSVDLGKVKIGSKSTKEYGIVHFLRIKVDSRRLLPRGITFAKWKLSCTSQSGQGLPASAESETLLFVRNSDPFGLTGTSPEYFSVGNGGNVTITGKSFPSDVQLACASAHYAFSAQSSHATKFKTRKIIHTPARFIDESTVRCEFMQIHQPAKILVHVLPQQEVEEASIKDFHTDTGGVSFEYRANAPEVEEARLTDDLAYIHVTFDTAVTFRGWKKADDQQLCTLVLEASEILGSGARCYARGSDTLLIRPGKGAVLDMPGTRVTRSVDEVGVLVLREGAVEGRASGGAYQSFPKTRVTVLRPKKMKSPQLQIVARREVEPCEEVVLQLMVRGAGTWPVTFQWDVDVEEEQPENTPEAIRKFLAAATEDVTSSRISFKKFKGRLQPGGSYTFRLTVMNVLGGATEREIQIRILTQNSVVRTAILGPEIRRVRSSADFRLKALTKFLKPKCAGDDNDDADLSDSSVEEMDTTHVWEVTSDSGATVDIGTELESVLKVASGSLKPGNYTVSVTAFYFIAGIEMGSASASVSVEVESSAVEARIVGPASRVVVSTETLTLDGSKSSDPDGSVLGFAWSCVEVRSDAPCSVFLESQSNDSDVRKVERADAAFQRYQSVSGVLSIPADLFQSGVEMRITLTVSSEGGRVAAKSVRVLVKDADDHLPVIFFKSEKNLGNRAVPTHRPSRVKARVIGNKEKNWTMIITWSVVEGDGLASLDLEEASLTAIEEVREITGETSAEFPLVLAANSLQPGSLYALQVQARPDPDVHPVGENEDETQRIMYAEVTLSTLDAPKGGSFSVSPENGTAAATEFTLQAPDWVAENDALSYRFAYKVLASDDGNDDEKRRGLTFLGSFTDQPYIADRLPPGIESKGYRLRVFAFIRIGEDDDTIRVESKNVTVYPASFDDAQADEIAQEIYNEAAESLVSGDRSETISKLVLLKKSGSRDQEREKAVQDLVEATFKKIDESSPTSESDASDALDSVNTLLESFTNTSKKSKRIASEVVENTVKNVYKKDSEGSRRRRETDPVAAPSLSATMAEKMLEVYDNIFSLASGETDLLVETRPEFKGNTEFMMESFCNDLAYGEPAQTVTSEYSLVSARQVEMGSDVVFGETSLTFLFGSAVKAYYSDWMCDDTAVPCQGACVSHGLYQLDVLETYDSSDDIVTRVAPIAGVFIRTPSGEDASSQVNVTGLSEVMRVFFKDLDLKDSDGLHNLECRRLDLFSFWSDEECEVTHADITEVMCSCNIHHGYFSVFRVSSPAAVTTAELATTSEEDSANRQQPTTTPATTTTTRPTQVVACKEPKILAKSCPKRCLDWCRDQHAACTRPCIVGESCLCPAGKFPTFDGGCSDYDECNPGPSSLTVAAIVGLTVGIVLVSVALIVVLYLWYRKTKYGPVSPVNSNSNVRSRALYNEAYDESDISNDPASDLSARGIRKENEYSTFQSAPRIKGAPPKYSKMPPSQSQSKK